MNRTLIGLLIGMALPWSAWAGGVTGSSLAGAAAQLDTLKQIQAQQPTVPQETTVPTTMEMPAVANPEAVPTPTMPSVAKPGSEPGLQGFDYTPNLQSDVFGANLFSGAFAQKGSTRFNPDYLVQVGDSIIVRLWGAFAFDESLGVDQHGNIFIPNVGPVKVRGIRNEELQKRVESAVRSVYRKNVSVYASLDAAQPVRIYVGGFVNRAGLYDGTSMDSLLNFLDRAGGIDPQRGSFINVEVKRGEKVRARVNLYDFLLKGYMPNIQLADGDVIYVTSRNQTAKVSGLAESAKFFEFKGNTLSVRDLVAMARPQASATHVRVNRNTGSVRNTEYYALAEADNVVIYNGDEVEFTADKKPGTITVRVEGEHESAQEYVLPYDSKLGDLMKNIRYYPNADQNNIQLFRKSVRDRQKVMLATALRSLETSVLTARSATNEESRLRKDEAELMLQWVERAKQVEPSGQVIVAQSKERAELPLENGDIIRIPKKDGLVLVSGEVLFPNAVAYESGVAYDSYIKRAGGYSQSADTSRVIVAHRDGSYEEVSGGGLFSSKAKLAPGDEILVLPKVQTKSVEVTRGITQILYQMAIAAKVILDL